MSHVYPERRRQIARIRRERMIAMNLRHGKAGTPAWRSWQAMLGRCKHPGTNDYASYGGRGIRVCERWKSFENFFADMGDRPPGKSLDRINPDSHYEPGNCRWATSIEQNRNRRNNRRVEFKGELRTVTEWERLAGLKPGCLFKRLNAGWPIELALTLAPHRGRRVAR